MNSFVPPVLPLEFVRSDHNIKSWNAANPSNPQPPEFQHCLLLELTPIKPGRLSLRTNSVKFFYKGKAPVSIKSALSTKIKVGLGVDQGLTRSKPDTGMVPLEHDD